MKRKCLTGPEKKRIAASSKWTCGLCFLVLPSNFEIDHKVPLWKGGLDEYTNMWALCPSCHSVKTEGETIERIKKKHSKTETCILLCQKCNFFVSPYFVHKCS